MKITCETLVEAYLEAAEAQLFTRFVEADYQRMVTWVMVEYNWSVTTGQLRGAIHRLRQKYYVALERRLGVPDYKKNDDG
jgi:hypothetical protein